MQLEKLEELVMESLEDLKGIDIVTIDVRGLTTIADKMIICSGRSSRHVQSLAESVVVSAKKNKVSYIKMEGEREGEWIIVDLGDIIVHVMQPAQREFYRLEDLWEPVQKQREQRG